MCAAALKHWREAATTLLVHQRKPVIHILPKIGVGPKSHEQTTDGCLEMLVLKRSSTSSFMPNLYVFPGGTGDDVDFSRDWLEMFQATTPEKKAERFGFLKKAENAPLFTRARDEQFSHVPSEIAFRICAIRETFEESGVLLARKEDSLKYFKHNSELCKPFSFGDNHISESKEWRQKIIKEPTQFLQLCKTFGVVPDVWSLFDWSNWLTPISGQPNSKRFDAAFFICCLQDKPHVLEDASETVHSQWCAPQEMIQENHQGTVQLAPPQLYEAHRLLNFPSIDNLLGFLQQRTGQPMERWMPVRVECKDAVLFLFPGDSLYPSEPDIEGVNPPFTIDKTVQELTSTSPHRHRGVRQFPPTGFAPGTQPQFVLECNVQPNFGHVKPLL